MAAVIEYVSEGRGTVDTVQIRRGRILLRIVQACAVGPMAVGVAIVLLYWISDWEWLVGAGIILMPIGTVVVVTGLGLAIAWGVNRRSIAKRMGEGMRWTGVVALLFVLLANFGVAIVCAGVGSTLATGPRVFVQLTNESGAALGRCTLSGGWSRNAYADLGNGGSQNASWRARRVGTVHIRVEQGGKSKEMDIVATKLIRENGGMITVRVKPGLEMESEVNDARGSD